MGKRTKKIKKNIISTNGNKNSNDDLQKNLAMMIEIRSKIVEYKEKGQYEEALTVIVGAFEKGCINQELLSETAKIYYALGDYERTIVWAKKVLTFDNRDVDGQLLLAKVYALQDEMNSCFTAIEDLLKGHKEISVDVCSEVDDLLLYFQDDYEESELESRYPLLFAYLRSAEGSEETADDEEETLAENLSTGEDEDEVDAMLQESVEFVDLQEKNVEDVIHAIMGQSVSLIEKLDACIRQAMDYYSSGDFVKSLMLLKQALLIDGTNDLALKNTAVVLIDMDECAGALEVLSKIKEKDFMVLKQIVALSK